jgi:hypothetical protein
MLISNQFHSLPHWGATEYPSTLTTDLSDLQVKLPQYDSKTVAGLMNVHRGQEGGRMETLGLLMAVTSRDAIKVNQTTVKFSNENFPLDLEWEATHPSYVSVPKYVEFTADWDSKAITSGEGNNILGDNGGLYFEESSIRIPVVKATSETLAYYGAVLIPENSIVKFPNENPFPLWQMDVGSDYVKDYIMTEEGGGGFYLEFHHDQPHFHQVVNGGGYYLLAKKVADKTFRLTAFELSNGQAVYTKKGAIHCDAALTGNIICGYSASDDCETVLLRTKKGKKMMEVEFEK